MHAGRPPAPTPEYDDHHPVADRLLNQGRWSPARGLRRALVLLAALAAAMIASACGVGGLPPLAPDQVRAQQTVNGMTITLDTQRDPQINQPQRFRVTLTDRLGRPLDGANVYLDLDMNMICLSGAQPLAIPVGPGQYEARSVYQMAGEWEITVYAQVNGELRQALFRIHVADPDGSLPG
ncbi:MAG: FixH family protein [Chloroflexaceae bacterium]